MTPKQPPRIATWMLRHFGCGSDIDAVLGDLAEQYLKKDSAMWYWRQAMKAIPISLLREVRANKGIAARALFTGWALWVFSLMWFFPFVMPHFFDLHGDGIGVAITPSEPILSAWSVLIAPVGAPFSINKGGFGDFYGVVFSVALPLIVAALCGWLVARFHTGQRIAVVLLFAGSILFMDLLLFGTFVIKVGGHAAYLLVGPLAAYVAASVLGILIGGGLLRVDSRVHARI